MVYWVPMGWKLWVSSTLVQAPSTSTLAVKLPAWSAPVAISTVTVRA